VHRVAVIQARMGSSRLPGKVLKPLAGRPVLEHVVTRVMAARLVDAVVVATSDLPGDEPIADCCAARGWTCVRGSESDVLSRYAMAARTSNADLVIRVTSDCPLFSPRILDDMLAAFDPEVTDYMSTNWPERTFPVGLDCEIMRADALLAIAETATDPYDREHVTPHFYRNLDRYRPDRYRIAGHACVRPLAHIRITLDTAQDYDRLTGLLAAHPQLADPRADIIGILADHFGEAPPSIEQP
jgi:spore coat polysaccharide biosynthesis protein SpsF